MLDDELVSLGQTSTMSVREGDIAIIDYHARVIDDGKGVVAAESGQMRLRAGDCGAVGGIDIAVIGMSVNEKKNLTVPPCEAFGERDPALIMILPRSKFHSCPWLKPGSLVKLHSRDGKEIEVVAREVDEESVTVDANHPLAGMTLSFEMTVLSIEDSKKSR